MIDVTCAIIERAGMVLAARRGPGMHLEGMWEFPGGKLRADEPAEACIVREIKEELCLDIELVARLEDAEHEYPDKHIRLLPFVCALTGGELELGEHSEVRWLWPEDLARMEFCPADLPVIQSYLNYLR